MCKNLNRYQTPDTGEINIELAEVDLIQHRHNRRPTGNTQCAFTKSGKYKSVEIFFFNDVYINI